MSTLISTLLAIREHARGTMQEREQTIRQLADDLPQPVWMAASPVEMTFANRHYLKYTGVDSVEALCRQWKTLIHDDDRESAVRGWNDAAVLGNPYLAEYRLRRFDAAFRHCTVAAMPVHDDAGKILGWLGVVEDIHERKLKEQERELQVRLSAVARLASSVAHEINNPLESVVNALYIALQDKTLQATTRHFLKIAESELQRLTHMTSHALRFHNESSAPISARLSLTMEGVLELYGGRLKSAGIQVIREYRTWQPIVCCEGDFRQVFASLIHNALDAGGPGGRLLVRVADARSWADNGAHGIRVTIADTGEGIAKEHVVRLFEPFFSTRGGTRTGLALWVADQIVRKHRGRIRYRSRKGGETHWTVFSIFLPFGGLLDR